jgi:hypothetical protein
MLPVRGRFPLPPDIRISAFVESSGDESVEKESFAESFAESHAEAAVLAVPFVKFVGEILHPCRKAWLASRGGT